MILIRYFATINLIILSFALSGCATTPPGVVETTSLPQPYRNGIYHTVLPGQTLWRIAKAYKTDIKEIIDANRISVPSQIEKGQMIFIPGAKEPVKEDLNIEIQESERGYVWPVRGRVVSYYGTKKGNVTNKGIDIEVEEGRDIIASRSGKVVFCNDKVKGLGKAIIIDHGDGYSTVYANNSVNLVESGDYVKQYQSIAKAGRTGRAEKPTLHFQIRKGHKPQNPFYYLP